MKLGKKESTITIAFAVIFVSILVIGFYPIMSHRIYSYITGLPPETFSTIYILDQQKQAADYPGLLVINQNSTINLWIVVENQMDMSKTFSVLQKMVRERIPTFPVEANIEESYSKTIENGDTWETLATVSMNEVGSYAVIFELWIYDEVEEAYNFSNNYCVLKIEVTEYI